MNANAQLSPHAVSPGRTALVTGGASGIGLGLATVLLERGMQVVIGDVRPDHLATARYRLAHHGERLLALNLDVANHDDWAQAADTVAARFGPLHILCLNAGIGVMGTILDSRAADWRWLMEVNFAGVTNGVETFLPAMRAHGEGGHILATSSMGGLTVAEEGGVYSCAKFGVTALTECLRQELADAGIGVSLLCPAAVNTNIHDHDTMRPVQHSDSGLRKEPELAAKIREMSRHILSQGVDPVDLGRRVADAIDRNDFYIFTDGAVAPTLKLRRDALAAAARTSGAMA